MTYNSPKEFADLVKSELYEYTAEPDDLDIRLAALRKHYAAEIAESGIDLQREYTETNTKYQEVIDLLVADFFATLSWEIREWFIEHFYFTTIDNRHMNASVKRSPDKRFYGVFLNSSLITLLHKFGKLDFAVLDPDCVVFCSRFPDSKPVKQDLVEMFAEMYITYSHFKLPLGPQLILNKRMSGVHLLRLREQEQLLLFHELGHFLNGDLSEDRDAQRLAPTFPNIHYQRECLADLAGFALLLRQYLIKGKVTLEIRQHLLYSVISMYSIQHGLQGDETDKYPHPLDRMCQVIDYFYGQEMTERVEQTIKADKMRELTPESLPRIVSKEQEMLFYVEQQLKKVGEGWFAAN